MSRKQRIDALMVQQGLAQSRERAKALLMAGKVLVNGHPVTKAGTEVPNETILHLKEDDIPYVSRGGVKLDGALQAFSLDVTGLTCIDVGASTGGFTDCLLQKGATRVYAIDVGFGQLDWKLRNDPRVSNHERVNARYLDQLSLPEAMDLAVMDLSFISLSLILPALRSKLKPGALVLAMVKPQFEVGPQDVGRSGVVRDDAVRARAIQDVREAAERLGYRHINDAPSTLAGVKGNVEHFLLLAYDGAARPLAPDAATPDAMTPDAVTPDAATPDAVTPDAVTPDAVTPDAANSPPADPDSDTPEAGEAV